MTECVPMTVLLRPSKNKRNKGKGRKSKAKGSSSKGSSKTDTNNDIVDDTNKNNVFDKKSDVLDQLLDRLTSNEEVGPCTHGCPSTSIKRSLGSARSFVKELDRQLNEAQNNTRDINKNGGHEQHGISKEEVERLNMLAESEDEVLSVSEKCLVVKWRMQSGTYVLNDIHDQGRTKLLSDPTKRKQVLDILLALGTDYVLTDNYAMATSVAIACLKVELFGCMKGSDKSDEYARGMIDDYERACIKFFYRNANCSCLKEKWNQAKSLPKIGYCGNLECSVIMETKDFLLCHACKITSYCSEECQKIDWSRHRGMCEQWRNRSSI